MAKLTYLDRSKLFTAYNLRKWSVIKDDMLQPEERETLIKKCDNAMGQLQSNKGNDILNIYQYVPLRRRYEERHTK